MSSTTSYGAVPTTSEEDTESPRGLNSEIAPVKKKSCNDILFAILFLAHICYLIYSWFLLTPEEEDEVEVETDNQSVLNVPELDIVESVVTQEKFTDRGVLRLVGVSTGTALVLSTLAIIFMTTFSDELVHIALAAPILGAIAVGGYGIYIAKVWMMVTGGVGFLLFGILACCVMKRVDFASANLRTALTVIRTNAGLIVVAYFLELVAFAWTVVWFGATGLAMNGMGWYIVFLYLLSFFWTHQVINNLQHTIVASVLATWWYRPQDANSCWDDGLNQAICHSTTFSFGSICFGSLLASFVQALKWTHRLFSSQTNRCGRCVTWAIDCCLSCVQGMVEYFNKWAFVMVGIHGESYISSGREVIRLFKARNWVGIVADGLADMVMFCMKLAIALVTGLVGWWLVKYDNNIFVGIGIDPEDDDLVGFFAGLLIGYIVASIMMELVSSAVNAVIVCFALSPALFKKNYPELATEMLEAWQKAYPMECEDEFASFDV